MKTAPPLLVLDTNTLVRGVSNPESFAGRIIAGCRNRAYLLLLSKPVIREYQQVLRYPKLLRRNPEITRETVALLLKHLLFVGEYHRRVVARFSFARDPDDAKFLELAIEGNATHIITHDRDLLELSSEHSDAAKRLRQRLPHVLIVTAELFMKSSEDQRR